MSSAELSSRFELEYVQQELLAQFLNEIESLLTSSMLRFLFVRRKLLLMNESDKFYHKTDSSVPAGGIDK